MKVIRKNLSQGDCTIVAAFNAASWCRKRLTYSSIRKKASEWFDWSDKVGLTLEEFPKFMKKLRIPAKLVKNTPFEMQEEIYSGKAYIVGYIRKGMGHGHIVVVFQDKYNKIKILNGEEGVTWNQFAAEIVAGGMTDIVTLELPHR